MKHGIIQETKVGVSDSQLATKQSQPSSKSPRAGSSKDTLDNVVMPMINSWLKYRKQLLPIWERSTKLYNNQRVERHYEGVADTFVPMSFSTIETMVAALVTGDLSIEFLPQDIYKYLRDRFAEGYVENEEKTEDQFIVEAIRNVIDGGVIEDETLELLNALYDYYSDCGDWARLDEKFIKSGLKIGNGAQWMVWENNKPKLIHVPFPNYVFDPNGSDDESVSFAGRKYLASLKDLKAETIVDPESGKVKKRYNLNGLSSKSNLPEEDEDDKKLKEEMLFGSTTADKDSKSDDQVEVIEIRTKERAYVVINRKCLAEDVENPIVTQAKLRGISKDELILIPGITWANYEDESLFIGKSEIETFWQEQERLNDATNQKSDAVTRALLQQYRADPTLKSQKESFSVPGAVIWGTANTWEAIPPAIVPAAAFTEEQSIKNNIREVTATDQIVKGVGGTKDVTATEAQLQVAQSGQRIEMKIESLARGPFKRRARLTLQYIRLFVTDPFIIPEKANNGFSAKLYDPKKFDYVYEPKVTLTIMAQNKQKSEQRDSLETYQILIQDPTNNLEAIKKKLLPKITGLDKDEIESIIKQPEEMIQDPMMAEDPMAQVPSPEMAMPEMPLV